MPCSKLYLFLMVSAASAFVRGSPAERRGAEEFGRRGAVGRRSSAERSSLSKRVSIPAAGYYDPAANGGSMLTIAVAGTNLGEPVNMIISAQSDAAVLIDQTKNGGLRNYFNSLHFSDECLGQQDATSQQVDLGDGNGYLNETAVQRYNYGDPALGTCTETIEGGDHFRFWIQNGPSANSGAVFMACSYEMPIAEAHNIVVNGYNLGRDYIIGNLTNTTVPTTGFNATYPVDTLTTIEETTTSLSVNGNTTITSVLTTDSTPTVTGQSTTTIVNTGTVTANGASASSTLIAGLPFRTGQTWAAGYTYSTEVTYVTGLLSNTSNNINHGDTVGINGNTAIDGLVAVLTVKIVETPAGTNPNGAVSKSVGMGALLLALVIGSGMGI